jgi:hypothetical protein
VPGLPRPRGPRHRLGEALVQPLPLVRRQPRADPAAGAPVAAAPGDSPQAQEGQEQAMMTDIWCFTCSHELRRPAGDVAWQHIDADDLLNCPCADDGEECEP